jgi:hypothetical protein
MPLREIDINSRQTDALSPLAYEILAIDKEGAYSRLVVSGDGNRQAAQKLRDTKPDGLLSQPAASDPDAQSMLAGLWLWHDWLDSSHVISQSIHSATGSFWHAIMHRREGDFSNAKYWFARCREHPVLRQMAPYAGDILNPLPADKMLLRLSRNGWDPDSFVDLVEEVHDRPGDSRQNAAVMLQKLEWRLLFDHCTRAASGQ